MLNKTISLESILFENAVELSDSDFEEVKNTYYQILNDLQKIVNGIKSYQTDEKYKHNTPSLNVHNQSDRKNYLLILSKFKTFVDRFPLTLKQHLSFSGSETKDITIKKLDTAVFLVISRLASAIQYLANLDIDINGFSISEKKLIKEILKFLILPIIKNIEEDIKILHTKSFAVMAVNLLPEINNIKENISNILKLVQISFKPSIKKETVKKINDLNKFLESYVRKLMSNAAQGTAIEGRFESTRELATFITTKMNDIARGESYNPIEVLKAIDIHVSDSNLLPGTLSKSFVEETKKRVEDIFDSLIKVG